VGLFKSAIKNSEIEKVMCSIFKRDLSGSYSYIKMFYWMEAAQNRELILSTMLEF